MKEAWHADREDRRRVRELGDQPQFRRHRHPSEVVVVCPFQIDLDGGGGSLHVVMPYSMIEPLREVLDSGVQSDRAEQDDRWLTLLKDGLQDAEVELTTLLGNGSVSLSEARGSRSPATCCPATSPARPRCSPKACRCSAARSASRAASSAFGTNRNTGAIKTTRGIEINECEE